MTRAKPNTLVIKVGSALLVEADGQPRRDWLATLVEDIAQLHEAGDNVIIVSSGSIALGALGHLAREVDGVDVALLALAKDDLAGLVASFFGIIFAPFSGTTKTTS